MIAYAESSAVLRWLLGAPGGEDARHALAGAEEVVTSELTRAEVGRVLWRLRAKGELGPDERLACVARWERAASHWTFFSVDAGVLIRAADSFAVEPVRTLDAIHLATAATYAAAVAPVAVLSLDERVRQNATAMGLTAIP